MVLKKELEQVSGGVFQGVGASKIPRRLWKLNRGPFGLLTAHVHFSDSLS